MTSRAARSGRTHHPTADRCRGSRTTCLRDRSSCPHRTNCWHQPRPESQPQNARPARRCCGGLRATTCMRACLFVSPLAVLPIGRLSPTHVYRHLTRSVLAAGQGPPHRRRGFLLQTLHVLWQLNSTPDSPSAASGADTPHLLRAGSCDFEHSPCLGPQRQWRAPPTSDAEPAGWQPPNTSSRHDYR